MAQNISHAVMAQRFEPKTSLDDFPTPPWATRALLEVLSRNRNLNEQTCLEPACGRGYMLRPLAEYFEVSEGFDIFQYGKNELRDFLTYPYREQSYDWVITNPPFRLAEDFIRKALVIARIGVAILARTVFLESVGRYQNLYKNTPPVKFIQFSERVPMVRGRVDKKASSATGYAWFVWEKNLEEKPQLMWFPPCRKRLEKIEDYL